MARRFLHYVTGKGGVGKSTVSAALALAEAMGGGRVLAIELGEPSGLHRILGAAPGAPGTLTRSAVPGLWLSWFDGEAALAEYLTRRMRLGRLGPAVLAHPLYRAFAAAAPGLKELVAIGKVRDEAVLQHRWDRVVVDAGASGHALEHLRMPAAAARVFATGLVHREAGRNAALLADGTRCAVHVVATPEEMPLAEAAQVCASLRRVGLARGAVLVNQCRPAAPDGIDLAIARLAVPALAAVARHARAWERVQERGIAALEAELGAPVVRLPRLWGCDERGRAERLAPAVAEAAG